MHESVQVLSSRFTVELLTTIQQPSYKLLGECRPLLTPWLSRGGHDEVEGLEKKLKSNLLNHLSGSWLVGNLTTSLLEDIMCLLSWMFNQTRNMSIVIENR